MLRPLSFSLASSTHADKNKEDENPETDIDIDIDLGSRVITLIDLDPKSIRRLSKWAEQDRDIVASFKDAPQANDGGRRCVDAFASAYGYGDGDEI